MVSPIEYYEGVGAHDNEHPWAYMTAEELLDKYVDDDTAKRFFKVMARSDLATEPHNTNGLNALKNFVMDVDGYIGLYSIQNGNEQLIDCLRSEVTADIQLNHRVLKVGKTASRPLSAQHDERQGAGDAGLRSRGDVPAAFLARAPCAGTAKSCASRWSSTSPISTGPRIICGSRSCSTNRSGARRSPAPGGCRRHSAAAASTTRARAMTSASTAS